MKSNWLPHSQAPQLTIKKLHYSFGDNLANPWELKILMVMCQRTARTKVLIRRTWSSFHTPPVFWLSYIGWELVITIQLKNHQKISVKNITWSMIFFICQIWFLLGFAFQTEHFVRVLKFLWFHSYNVYITHIVPSWSLVVNQLYEQNQCILK